MVIGCPATLPFPLPSRQGLLCQPVCYELPDTIFIGARRGGWGVVRGLAHLFGATPGTPVCRCISGGEATCPHLVSRPLRTCPVEWMYGH